VLLQLLDQGLIEIAYDQGSTLKLSSLSQEVLFSGRRVQMVQPSVLRERQDQQRERNRPQLTKGQQFQVDVFEELRIVRRAISDREKLPPYQVFSDATLQQMAEHLPLLPEEMHDISGVGKVKFQRYGTIFMEELLRIMREREEKNAYMLPGTTTQVTYAFLKAKADIEHICQTRRIKEGTVYQHIGQLYEAGYPIELSLYLPDEIKSRVREAVDALGETDGLRPLYEHLNGEVPYHLIRLGMAWLEAGEAV
jgi:ATP-dependent DNA helicase RecQ